MSICHEHGRLARGFVVGVVAVCVTAVCSPASVKAEDEVVNTDKGPVRGIVTSTTLEFLGIPYAAAPVGDLRWQPPHPHARWRKPLDATRFGNSCAQPESISDPASDAEDCLFLNVYAPRLTGRDDPERDMERNSDDRRPHRQPVMVWLHGGGLTCGASNAYDPVKLVEEGHVIVVTINYRLGLLGFLSHPSLTAESPDAASGNYGLMDQQFALRWVRRNIALFGGDPDNITIFGESGGGLSVHSNLASPTAAGLFHKAIVQSGAYSLTQPALASAEALGTFFASLSGCSSQTAVCLRALPVATILAVQGSVLPNGVVPTVDGKVLTQSVAAAFASGQFNRGPVIEGSNHDEWRFFVGTTELQTGTPLTAAGYIPAIAATLGVSASDSTALATFVYPLAAYPPPSTAQEDPMYAPPGVKTSPEIAIPDKMKA